jgi:hypothetical protein
MIGLCAFLKGAKAVFMAFDPQVRGDDVVGLGVQADEIWGLRVAFLSRGGLSHAAEGRHLRAALHCPGLHSAVAGGTGYWSWSEWSRRNDMHAGAAL